MLKMPTLHEESTYTCINTLHISIIFLFIAYF